MVEPLCDLAGEFNVLFLIRAHGDVIGTVNSRLLPLAFHIAPAMVNASDKTIHEPVYQDIRRL